MTLGEIMKVYDGSDGEATKQLYARLAQLGPAGAISVELFRGQKASRAKVYRGGGFRGKAYDRKQWALDNLVKTLAQHAEALSLQWGWGVDPKQEFHNQVLYVDLPTGQASFHSGHRGAGPDYHKTWDEVRDASAGRILQWIVRLFAAQGCQQ